MSDIIGRICGEVLLIFLDHPKTQKMCNEAVTMITYRIYNVSGQLNTVEMCQETVKRNYWCMWYVPDWLETIEMCNKAVKDDSSFLASVPDCLKSQEMCNEVVRRETFTLGHVPDHLKTEKMSEKAFCKEMRSLKYVPDWFVTDQKIWEALRFLIGRYCLLDDLIKWYEGYKKRKAQEASIKEELIPIASLLSLWWDWCVPEDEKQVTEKLFLTT